MPWQNQGGGGGGPWGGGGGGGPGPWGRGPGGGGGGGGPQPPNIEELLRRGQDRMRSLLPGGMGSMRGLLLVGLVAVGVWLASGFYTVQPEQLGIVLRFGQYVRDAEPGLRYHLPAPIERALTPNVTRENRVEVGFRSVQEGRAVSSRDLAEESLMLTGDENIVDIGFTVFWKIKDAKQFLFGVREPEVLVKVAAESAMREVVGQTKIQQALTEGREKIEVDTQSLLQKLLDSYGAGIEIRRVQLLAVDPPAQVVDAFNDVQRARADRERLRNEAEAYRNDIIPRARGDAERLLQEAQAYREEVTNRAQGDAKRFQSVYQAYLANKDVTAQRMYLETMEQVLRNTNKVILDRGEGGQGVVPYLPLPELKPKPPATGPVTGKPQ
jgi:membrane protease subunit HflK